jgi:hypothetical protein
MNIDFQKFCSLCETSLLDILSGFGSNPGVLRYDYSEEDYKNAKAALIIQHDNEGKPYEITYEEVLESIVYRGGKLTFYDIEDDDNTPYTLDLAALERGVDGFIENAKESFADYLNGNGDSIADNVFIQCCLFGKPVYA